MSICWFFRNLGWDLLPPEGAGWEHALCSQSYCDPIKCAFSVQSLAFHTALLH